MAVAASALCLAGCGQNGAAAKPAAEPEPPEAAGALKTATAAMRLWPRAVQVQGSLLGDERVVVSAKVAGRVKSLGDRGTAGPNEPHDHVDLGSPVCPGDVLVALETEDFDLRVKQAEAQAEQIRSKLGLRPGESEGQLDRSRVPAVAQHAAVRNEAKLNLERGSTLAAGNAISQEDLQARQAAVEVAESQHRAALNDVEEQLALLGVRSADLALARQAQADAVIRAPFQGVIEQRHTAPGGYLKVGDPVVTLVRTDPLRFHAGVPEREAVRVRLRQKVRIRVEGQPEPVESLVTRISPSLDMANRSLAIEADVPNSDLRLRAGLFARAEIVVDPEARALAVPESAVTEFAGVEKVRLVRDGRAAESAIETGRRDGPWVEVLRGLGEGDVIAVGPPAARGE